MENAREIAVLRSGLLQGALDPELASIVAFTAAKNDTYFAALSIITGHRQILLTTIGIDTQETPRHESFCTTTIQKPGEVLIVPDTTLDPRFAHLPAVVGEPFVRFYAGVPVLDRNGYALGALCIGDREPRLKPFNPTDLQARGREIERVVRGICW